MMEGVKRKEERDRECLIRVGYSSGGAGGGGGGGGAGLPSILSGCGSPLWTSSHRHPQLMNQTWLLPVRGTPSPSLGARAEQSTAPLIF